jgi:hypothetical protein
MIDVADLAVMREIEHLKYRYLRTLDLKDWDAFADTLTEDVVGDYGPNLHFEGRDALVGFMRSALGPELISLHNCHHPELVLDGDTATGTWYLEDQVIVLPARIILTGAAFYEDTYRREDGVWRISGTGYRRTFEAVQSLDDVPSWKLTANRFA